jgi:hypothetical protein
MEMPHCRFVLGLIATDDPPLALTTHDEAHRAAPEAYVLKKAALLSGYELRDVLKRNWLPVSVRSAARPSSAWSKLEIHGSTIG